MNKFTFKKLLLIITLAFSSSVLTAQDVTEENQQNEKFKSHMYVTGELGGTALSGEVNKIKPGFNGNLGLGLQFDKYFGLNANIGYGTLRGEMKDVFSIKEGNYVEGDINLTISLIDLIGGYKADRLVTLTPHIGIGHIQYRTKIEKADGQAAAIGYNNHDGNNVRGNGFGQRVIAATIPVGLQLGFNINPKWNIYLDYTAKFADSDRIDCFPAGKHNDWISNLNIGARYNITRNAAKSADGYDDNEYCNYWYFTVDGGANYLFGDNKAWKGRDVKGNANIGVGYAFHNFMTVFGKIGYGSYEGGKDNFFAINEANYISTTVNFGIDLMNAFNYKEDRKFGLIPHIGFGAVQYRATTVKGGKTLKYGYDKDNANVKGNGLQGRRVVAEVPMGLELTYKMNKRIDLFFDGTVSYCNTDLLDGVASGKHDDWMARANAGVRFKLNTSCERKAKKDALMEKMTPQIIQCSCPKKTDTVYVPVDKVDVREKMAHQNYTDVMFPVSKSEKINNQVNKNAIARSAYDLEEGYVISSIIVEGYASPEGSEENNQKLAEDRANVAAEFVKDELGDKIGDAGIEVVANGGDWEGLYRAIEGSNIKDKDNIVEQLKNASDRRATLNNLVAKYPEIKNLFSQLRRAGVTINTEMK